MAFTLSGTVLQLAVLVGAGVLAALLMLLAVRRGWPPEVLNDSNSVNSYFGQVIGTIYAIILAFTLSDAWTSFESARATTHGEANAAVNIFRLAAGLTPAQRTVVQEGARRYVDLVVRLEWPAMQREQMSPEAQEAHHHLGQAIIALKPDSQAEQTIMATMLQELVQLSAQREERKVQNLDRLPALLWLVLILAGFITVGFSCFFGVPRLRLHMIPMAALVATIVLILFATLRLNAPYQGEGSVPPRAFEVALKTMQHMETYQKDR